ncbi:hypothetical protein C2U31_19525 [Achromobacter sp. AONIH1]|nr:hypothetical protein C2U31_19525 [Achromobacter sp. AONIH1]
MQPGALDAQHLQVIARRHVQFGRVVVRRERAVAQHVDVDIGVASLDAAGMPVEELVAGRQQVHGCALRVGRKKALVGVGGGDDDVQHEGSGKCCGPPRNAPGNTAV